MSYLLKALEKAEQERNQQNKVVEPVKQVEVYAALPLPLIVFAFLLIAVSLWQLLKSNESIPEATPTTQSVSGSVSNDSVKPIKPVASTQKSEVTTDGLNQNAVLELSDLDDEQLRLIPSISIQSHIYSSQAQFRSVVINDNTYREGQLLNALISIKQITPNGVLIDLKGQDVKLPKGITWVATQHVK